MLILNINEELLASNGTETTWHLTAKALLASLWYLNDQGITNLTVVLK